ncbi:helix-turn-helix domain-containing protein [Amycolatopsis thermoflava]|uniref:helix-turn-helix domain-containing protein n=1 Tax=Amycolatopsis thermoflava TaxID=84480 RepID=UPI003EBCE53B
MNDAARDAYRTDEVADRLGVPYRTVMRAISRGEIGAIKLGRYYVVPRSELERLLGQAKAA